MNRIDAKATIDTQSIAAPDDSDSALLIGRAGELAPLLRETAREAELARRPLDRVVETFEESGLCSLMVPKVYGGYEQDLDTFFEVVLTMSRADASMGWLLGFYIEHCFWFLHFPKSVSDQVYGDNNYALAPATLNVGGGRAEKVDGGYRLSGQWQWGTGIVHATWVMAGAMVMDDDGTPTPTWFLLPRDQVDPVDTWFISGLCGTGSWDFKIDDMFIPDDHALPFMSLIDLSSGIADRYDAPLCNTPLMPMLGIAAAAPMLGAAQMALDEYCVQTKAKIEKGVVRGGAGREAYEPNIPIGEAALKIETAELLIRDVISDLMARRADADMNLRSRWLSRLAHAVYACKDAATQIGAETGASGAMLDNPIQRAVRDIAAGSNHIIFAKYSRYGDYGRQLVGRPIQNVLV